MRSLVALCGSEFVLHNTVATLDPGHWKILEATIEDDPLLVLVRCAIPFGQYNHVPIPGTRQEVRLSQISQCLRKNYRKEYRKLPSIGKPGH